MKGSKLDAGRLVQGIILFVFSIYLIKLLVSGEVFRMLTPLAANLLYATVAVMIVMTFYCFMTMFRKEEHDHGHVHSHGEVASGHEHGHSCGHDHGHEHTHTHACGHDHSHEHTHSHACGHDHHSHDHGHAHAHASCGHDHHHHGEDCEHDHDHNPKPRLTWAIIAFPAILGILVPTQALGSSMMGSGLQITPTTQIQITNVEENANQTASGTSQGTTTTADGTTTSTDPAGGAGTGSAGSGTSTDKPATADGGTAQPNNGSTAAPLGSVQAASFRTDMSKVPKAKGPQKPAPKVDQELKMNDMANNIAVQPENYYDKRFKFQGFVYRPEGWPDNQFILLRYMIAHCSADASAVGLLVETKEPVTYQNDQWVEVYATVSLKNAPGLDEFAPTAWFKGYSYKPILVGHTVTPIEEPKHPYLYSDFSL